MNRSCIVAGLLLASVAFFAVTARAADLIPPTAGIKTDRPRLLLRPTDTPYAVSLRQLRAIPHDADYQTMLKQIDGIKDHAATQAMVYLLTGKEEAAQNAIRVMQDWKMPPKDKGYSPHSIWFHFADVALAYDWLHVYPGFGESVRRPIREKMQPYAEAGFKYGHDHVFSNYIWMFQGGAMLWAMAAAGEDPAADRLLADLRERFNTDLFGAMEYLQGSSADGAGYWMHYCQNISVFVALATQSAFETDVRDNVCRNHGDWLNRQLDLLALQVLPDMRFIPWGDTVVGGSHGGVTHEMASRIDQFAWLTGSPHGAYLSRWLAEKRGLKRFFGDTAIYYFLYTRNLSAKPAAPPLAVRAGGEQGGEVVCRSDWTDGATVVGFRCSDYFGQHLHYDQGSFVIYRNGMLAMDAGSYLHMNGSQIETSSHNTLLLGGRGQRPLKFQTAKTLQIFIEGLKEGPKTRRLEDRLETGDIPFYHDAGGWTAVAGQFAQAYEPAVIQSCVRQLLYVRPGTVVVVDQLAAPAGKSLPEVQWLLQVPRKPQLGPQTVTATNAKSYLRCRALVPGTPQLKIEASPDTADGQNPAHVGDSVLVPTSRCVFAYAGQPRLTLVHLLEVADGQPPAAAPPAQIEEAGPQGVKIKLGGKTFYFSGTAPYEVSD